MQEEIKRIVEKIQEVSMESTSSYSSYIKYELYNAKEKSTKREKGTGKLLDRIRWKKYKKRKGVRTKPKG